MTDKSKWFVYNLENGAEFGCFRIRPYSDTAFKNALQDLVIKKSIFNMSGEKFSQEYLKIIANHLVQDWENIKLKVEGKWSASETCYTPENAYSMLLMGSIGVELAAWIVEKSRSF